MTPSSRSAAPTGRPTPGTTNWHFHAGSVTCQDGSHSGVDLPKQTSRRFLIGPADARPSPGATAQGRPETVHIGHVPAWPRLARRATRPPNPRRPRRDVSTAGRGLDRPMEATSEYPIARPPDLPVGGHRRPQCAARPHRGGHLPALRCADRGRLGDTARRVARPPGGRSAGWAAQLRRTRCPVCGWGAPLPALPRDGRGPVMTGLDVDDTGRRPLAASCDACGQPAERAVPRTPTSGCCACRCAVGAPVRVGCRGCRCRQPSGASGRTAATSVRPRRDGRGDSPGPDVTRLRPPGQRGGAAGMQGCSAPGWP